MMIKTLCLSLLLLVPPATMRGARAPAQDPGHGELDAVGFLVGGSWTAHGELPGVGRYTAERTYRWVLGGQFIEQRHVMTFGEVEMETLGVLGWDPDEGTIVTWGFGSDGGVVSARAWQATPTEVMLEGVRVGGFNAGPVRATFEKVGDDEFIETAETKQGDAWVPMFTFRFTRVSDRVHVAPPVVGEGAAQPARDQDSQADRAAVLATLDSWNRGWAEASASVAVEDYAADADWTNAFGDRFQGREALRDGLEFIFGLDFVMAGTSADNEFADVSFLTPDVALLRSKLVRAGQQRSDGTPMADRHIHHLRVLERRDGRWQIVSHLISQAQPKR